MSKIRIRQISASPNDGYVLTSSGNTTVWASNLNGNVDANQISYGSGDGTITGSTNLTWSDVNSTLNVIGSLSAITFYGSGIGLNDIPLSNITNLQSSLDLKTDLTLFNSHTADTGNPHQTSFSQLTNTAHTHTISDITDLQSSLNSKFNTSGGNITGNVNIAGITNNQIVYSNNGTLTGSTNLIWSNNNSVLTLNGGLNIIGSVSATTYVGDASNMTTGNQPSNSSNNKLANTNYVDTAINKQISTIRIFNYYNFT